MNTPTTLSIMIILLLAFALADSKPLAAQEPGKALDRLLVRNGDIMNTNGLEVTDENGLLGKKCFTFEHCKKKKMSCVKECSKLRGRIDKKHFIGRCYLKCKKCIPTC